MSIWNNRKNPSKKKVIMDNGKKEGKWYKEILEERLLNPITKSKYNKLK